MTHGRVTPPKKDGGLLGTVVSKVAGEIVKKEIGGDEGELAGGIVEDTVKSAFPSEGRPDVSDWVYELPRAMAKATRREGLGKLNPNVRPIPLPKIEQAADDAALLKLHKGSPDFIATNWSVESSYGTPQDSGDVKERPWDVYNEIEHRAAVMRAATATLRMLEARIRQELQRNPQAKVDLLIVGHSFGATVNREVILLLNRSELAAHLDFVKVVELDPVAMKRDPNAAERADSHDRYFWNSPELARNGRPIVDSIVNYYQTEGLAFTGVIEKGLLTGRPLDGQDGGGLLGFRNGHTMVFSPQSGETLDQFRLLNEQTGKPSAGDLRNGVYSDNGRLMALASEDGTVSLRDAVHHREFRRLVIGKAMVTDVQFLPGSEEIVTVSSDGRIRVFRVADGSMVWSDRHQAQSAEKASTSVDAAGTRVYRGAKVVAVSSDGRVLATAGTAERIRLWLRTPGADKGFEVAQAIPGHVGGTTSLSFAPDGTLVTGGRDGQLRMWKRGREFYEQVQVIDLTDPILKVQFSGDGRFLATASGNSVSMWMSGAAGELIRTRDFRDHVADAQALAFTSDSRLLATGGTDRTIFIYDTSSGAKVNVLNQAMLKVRNLAFSPDGSRLLATYFDMQGGPIRDINVTEQVRSRVGLLENVLSGGSKHHSEVPFVYIDLVIRQTNDAFFEMRDKPRASRYGDFEPGDLSGPDDDMVVGPAPGEAEIPADDVLAYPWIDQISNVHAPEFINSVADMTVTDALAISLNGLAMDADGNTLQWTVRSSDTATMLATIEGNSLQLRPLQEGRAEIELTANDGRWAGQIRFRVTADGSVWREKAATLRKEAESVVSRLRVLDSRIDSVESVLAEVNSQWRDLEDRVGRLRSGVADLQKQVTAAAGRAERLTQNRSDLLTARAAAESAVARAETALQSASATHAGLDATTRQLYQVFEQRQNERQQARQRLDRPTSIVPAKRLPRLKRTGEPLRSSAMLLWRLSKTAAGSETISPQNSHARIGCCPTAKRI
jgi:WD40 repeat protein